MSSRSGCPPVGSRDKHASLSAEIIYLLRRAGVGVCFDVAPLLVYDAAQLALHCFERVVNGFGQRRMRAVIHLFFSGNQFVPWSHRHIDADVIRIPLLVRVVSLLDGHVAAVDVIAKFLESRCIFQNEVVDLVRFFQTPVQDLNRQFHD